MISPTALRDFAHSHINGRAEVDGVFARGEREDSPADSSAPISSETNPNEDAVRDFTPGTAALRLTAPIRGLRKPEADWSARAERDSLPC